MKKQINIQQWDELTHEQKDIFCNAVGMKNDWKVTISEMIEFLGNGWLKAAFFSDDSKGEGWRDATEEMCDALWEAVKHKLNK